MFIGIIGSFKFLKNFFIRSIYVYYTSDNFRISTFYDAFIISLIKFILKILFLRNWSINSKYSFIFIMFFIHVEIIS